MKHIFSASSLATLVAAGPLAIRQNNSTTNGSVDSFADVPITKDAQWTTCLGGDYTCLNLEVPLDYDQPEIGTTNVAFLRLEASTQPALGDIIINPGGPGGSGVYTILNPTAWIGLLGTKYNLIGMDPRSVNNSGPNVDPLIDTPAARDDYVLRMADEYDYKSPAAVNRAWVHAGAYGDFAAQRLSNDTNYVNTPAVARDMLRFTELVAESRGEDPESAKLNFFGVSYGSILGTTFAQLFPDRVGRMIIDGIMDPSDYYDGAWIQSVNQADDAVRGFASHCFEAGSKCAFYANDTNPGAILQRLDTILRNLEENPLPHSDPSPGALPAVLTHMDLRNLIMWASYSPYARSPALASALAELEVGVGTTLAGLSSKGVIRAADCDGPVPAYSLVLSKFATACNDMDGRYNISSAAAYGEYIGKLEGVSSYIGGAWARVITLYCHNHQFSPPASQKLSGRSYKEVTTVNPILFVSNTIDPVTSSLDSMIEFFPGAGSFYQNAVGHGVIGTKSNCTSEHLIRYMETGELPPPDLVCEPNTKVFDDVV
ncbi:hypothetical protein C7974DRAFT_302450 [Boeremia exigua]|uniref:uncharacterized protein n=1 Tax=Boeremia exigua TaxID=749465 RepID=UPI001E8DB340|nr:uncharacterized protein C7974DRAFT_302450 [Boeremia exigua]KAH6642039.1 hypothetical protein C7974DRAFT_302450 [Boeremia exigua]